MKQILIIEDDVDIYRVLKEALKEEYRLEHAANGEQAIRLLHRHVPDLILLDLMLPDFDGDELLPLLQGAGIIVLSARNDLSSKVKLLESGASDYITKPFALAELKARIRAAFRKTEASSPLEGLANLSIRKENHEVFVDYKPLHLTPAEFALLELLVCSPNQVFSRLQLLDALEEQDLKNSPASLRSHLSNLRKKLNQARARVEIESVFGIGYRLSEN